MSDVQAHLVVDNTMGAAFIGVIIAACLYGVSCVQTWYYFNQYQTDVWYIKSLVAIVWLFDSVHQALISHTVYYYVVTNFSNPTEQENLVWSILLEVLFNGFIGFLVQSFLTMRVWRLGNENVALTAVITCLVLTEFGCSVAFTIQSMKLSTWADLTHMRGLSMTVNVVGAISDVLIAASLFYFLHRSRTGFKQSDTMISKLILFSVSTGLMTSVCAVASLISILIWGKTLIYVAFYFSLGRLYSNSVLATLNARKSIRGLSEAGDMGDLTLSLNTFKTGLPRFATTVPRQTNISIKIDTTQECVRDDIGGGLDSALTEKSEKSFKDSEEGVHAICVNTAV
ncbi:uncharacterized protein BT62DRAFT_141887 [Guyanagaster necrorhizus]|uniref:DUF6534 domain-containing protein n=1 Tax=Guyanagaster necrorhizus TaxID=856835 RepID=A0A9P7VT02_9AGAR|nr:uncharacterized protein BT62DRAFT_141887 [Guyanagaster necrorhizus MCA 3950]KAG7445905.1 hypothetical protein BT62DRAFT_141887 [Guyanagaster necrorhizus MCA 3950]